MEEVSNKILVITNVTNGICVSDSFISLAENLASSMGRYVDYFSFDKSPNFPEVKDLCDKDILDRLYRSIGKYDFVLLDKRLDVPTLNLAVGFILSEGLQVGGFFVDDPDLQNLIKSKISLRKHLEKSHKSVLIVSPDGSGEGDPVSISEAIDYLIKDDYNNIIFRKGDYDMSLLYQVLAYCYDTGVIVIDSDLPSGDYIRIIESRW